MTCDIFIRSYAKDFEWLGYCLESIRMYCSGFRDIVVVIPASSRPWLRRLRLPRLDITFHYCRDYQDDYLGQQATKLAADIYSDADLLCHVDSDCVFMRPVTPSALLIGDRPRVLICPSGVLGRHYPWREPTERFLGWSVEHDFMRHPPFMFPRWLYGEVRSHSQRLHGVDIDAYVTRQPLRGFSEFNTLGAFAYRHHRERFSWVDTSLEPVGAPHCRWYWSWGGLSEALRDEIELLLRPDGRG